MGGRLMKIGKHTAFMIDFISDFVNKDLERLFFDLDYSAYVIEHFPYMEFENPKLAERILVCLTKISGLKSPMLLING